MMSHYRILNKHTIIDMFCSQWTYRHISHIRFRLRCDIALRNQFSQNKLTILYIYMYIYSRISEHIMIGILHKNKIADNL